MGIKKKGIFISFEGGEGAGKTTQIELLAKRFRVKGRRVIVTREPGGTEKADRIRSLLLSHELSGIDPLAELLLYEASRAQHVAELIRPALQEGNIILCDRFTDSSLVYQGVGRKLHINLVKKLNQIATNDISPKVTLVLDIDPKVGLERIGKRGRRDRMESESIDFHNGVRKGYLQLSKTYPQRCFRINAEQSYDKVHHDICKILIKKKIL